MTYKERINNGMTLPELVLAIFMLEMEKIRLSQLKLCQELIDILLIN